MLLMVHNSCFGIPKVLVPCDARHLLRRASHPSIFVLRRDEDEVVCPSFFFFDHACPCLRKGCDILREGSKNAFF